MVTARTLAPHLPLPTPRDCRMAAFTAQTGLSPSRAEALIDDPHRPLTRWEHLIQLTPDAEKYMVLVQRYTPSSIGARMSHEFARLFLSHVHSKNAVEMSAEDYALFTTALQQGREVPIREGLIVGYRTGYGFYVRRASGSKVAMGFASGSFLHMVTGDTAERGATSLRHGMLYKLGDEPWTIFCDPLLETGSPDFVGGHLYATARTPSSVAKALERIKRKTHLAVPHATVLSDARGHRILKLIKDTKVGGHYLLLTDQAAPGLNIAVFGANANLRGSDQQLLSVGGERLALLIPDRYGDAPVVQVGNERPFFFKG